MRVFEILTVLPDLNRGVQHFALSSTDPTTQKPLRLGGLAVFPLFQLDYYRLIDIFLVAAANDAVDSPRT